MLKYMLEGSSQNGQAPLSITLEPESANDVGLVLVSFGQQQLHCPQREGDEDVQPGPESVCALVVEQQKMCVDRDEDAATFSREGSAL